MTALAQDTVNKLLDFNQKLDIGLLDQVVGTLYSGTGDQQKMAQEVLTTLKEHPDAWTKVRKLVENVISEHLNVTKSLGKTASNQLIYVLVLVDTIPEFSTYLQTKFCLILDKFWMKLDQHVNKMWSKSIFRR